VRELKPGAEDINLVSELIDHDMVVVRTNLILQNSKAVAFLKWGMPRPLHRTQPFIIKFSVYIS
jgi:hypothetical protein